MDDITKHVVETPQVTKKRRYKFVGEVKKEVLELRGTSAAGVPISYSSYGESITWKKKFYAIVYGMPTSGKSEFVLQECLHLSRAYGWRHVLFTPEQGDAPDIIALLVFKITGKTVKKVDGVYQGTDDEILETMEWLHKHFVIVDVEEGLTMQDLFDIVDEIQEEFPKWKPDNIVIDNHNDLKFTLDSSGRQDLMIEAEQTYLRLELKRRDMFAFLVTHTADLGKPMIKDNIKYYPVPDPTQTRGGQSLYRKGYMMISLWRCPYGLKDDSGYDYKRNQTLVTVQKAKPTGTGVKGFQGYLYWQTHLSLFTDQPPTITLQ